VRIVDPFNYRDRITQPKLLLLGANDPYWTVDAAQLYYPQMSGPKALFYLPNAGHNLGIGSLPTLNNFFAATLNGKPFPELQHEFADGALQVSWKGEAQPVLWTAESTDRDFRMAKWHSREFPAGERATVRLEKPARGWRASFVTVTFPGIREGDPVFGLSTPVRVVPDGFPHE
jgi:PhoPQ-activated pathogenicity-related protein